MNINPILHPLSAVVRVPGSKSLTNRCLLVASLAEGTTRLTNALFSDDSGYFARALQSLGFDLRLDPANHEMTINGLGGRIPASRAELFVGNAGTAARFLSAFLTLGHGEYLLDGEARMRERPIGDLVMALRQLGAKIEAVNSASSSRDGDHAVHAQAARICPPIKILASGLRGGLAEVTGDTSSQFLSALLMVAPYARSPVEIEVATVLNSKPYVDMTLAVMCDFGVEVEREGGGRFVVHPSRYESRQTYTIEPDASAASYFFAAPAICGGTVRVQNISRNTKQGDVAFLEVLEQMGCAVVDGNGFIDVHGTDRLRGVDVDMRDIPDTAQTLAVIAPFASTPTRMRGIASARLKETDRISATGTELTRLGVKVDEHEDGLTIYPCEGFTPAAVQTYDDHRMAMAFSLIGLRVPGVRIENPACVSKTFPRFFEVLESLR
jgi:3-phosphoshikimate 1-carboxyvinyltransferase